jgi:hypothetical protein
VDLDAFPRIPGEDRRDRPFVIGVRPDCYERSGLSLTTRARSSDKNQCRNNNADHETHVSSPSQSHPSMPTPRFERTQFEANT